MAKTLHTRTTGTPALLKRKKALVAHLRVPPDLVRASCVRQFLMCGKKNCRCARGYKHGPFIYLVQCLGVGRVRKFLLKSSAQREQGRASIAVYVSIQACLEELSQINTELLRRGELSSETPS